MTETVSVKQLRENLASYLSAASSGTEVIVTSHGKPLVKIVPFEIKRPRREARGLLRNKITMTADFDMLPDEIIAAMEGRLP